MNSTVQDGAPTGADAAGQAAHVPKRPLSGKTSAQGPELKISIAMATYNGERFLNEQLESFARQTRLPDEIVVSDDGSTDATVELLEEFAQAAPFPVRVYCNPEHRGLVENFAHAVNLCQGDLIFLSDQDDVWLEPKLESVEKLFRGARRPVLVINDAELMAADGHRTGITKAEQTRAAGLNVGAMETGCCTAFRRELVPLLLPFPVAYGNHDEWIHGLAKRVGPRAFLPETLQLYRRHENNASNAITSQMHPISGLQRLLGRAPHSPETTLISRLQQHAERADLVLNRLWGRHDEINALADEGWQAKRLAGLERRRDSARSRIELHRLPRILRLPKVVNLWRRGGYRCCGRWRSALADILLK